MNFKFGKVYEITTTYDTMIVEVFSIPNDFDNRYNDSIMFTVLDGEYIKALMPNGRNGNIRITMTEIIQCCEIDLDLGEKD